MTITNGYLTNDQAREFIGAAHDSADPESFIDDVITMASRAIDQFCNRHFWQSAAATARTFTACDDYVLELGPFNDLVSVSAFTVDTAGDGTFETTWTTSYYQLLPANPAAAPEQRPYDSVRALVESFPVPYGSAFTRTDRVKITGVWGWPAVPASVRQACRLMVSRHFKRQEAPFGVAGFGDYGVMRIRADSDVGELLQPYVHPKAAVQV